MLTGGWWLDDRPWTQADGPGVSFRLIQGGVPQDRKFEPDQRGRQLAHYLAAVVAEPAQIIATPETAFPLDITQMPIHAMDALSTFSKSSGSNLFLGIGSIDPSGKGFNSVYHLSPDSPVLERYDKRLLMPFGEYAPTGFRWFTDQMSLAWNDLSPGSENQSAFAVRLSRRTVLLGTLICHEELSGRELRRWLPSAGVLLNPGNLAWFQDSIAIDQRLQIARLRALESGRPILRSTNTGVTAHIDHKGRTVGRLLDSGPGVLRGVVQPMKGITPYARFGDLIGAVATLGALCLGIWLQARRHT